MGEISGLEAGQKLRRVDEGSVSEARASPARAPPGHAARTLTNSHFSPTLREVVGWTRPVLYGEPHTGPFVYTHTYLLAIKLGDRVRKRRDKREKHPVRTRAGNRSARDASVFCMREKHD
ncbi:hypothetical protein O3P69_016430 [Scylla paramamosain]|uniref:Uncharacterized protein n=1 Tax=Scylla paramamosain TaxID=85552 RepID=A0AAW0TFQ9_SCYPA